MAKKTNVERIATLKNEMTKKAVKSAEALAVDEPQIAQLAGLLVSPTKIIPELTDYDRSMAKQLGLSESEFLAAKNERIPVKTVSEEDLLSE